MPASDFAGLQVHSTQVVYWQSLLEFRYATITGKRRAWCQPAWTGGSHLVQRPRITAGYRGGYRVGSGYGSIAGIGDAKGFPVPVGGDRLPANWLPSLARSARNIATLVTGSSPMSTDVRYQAPEPARRSKCRRRCPHQ